MIILQYPTDLAPAAAIVHHAVAPDILDHHEGKLRGESRRLKLLEHAHQRNAHRPDTGMPKPPKQLCPAEGKKTRSEEHTSELQSLMRITYAVFCLQKKNTNT